MMMAGGEIDGTSKLEDRGYVSYPWIGASVYPLIPEFARFLNLGVSQGAVISQVVQGGPADRAGLRGGNRQVQVGNSLIPVGGDVITAMNGKELASSDELIRRIRDYRPGDKIELKILRDGKFLDVAVTLGERPQGQ